MPKSLIGYTYILRCSDGTLYTGWTDDLEKRVAAHNSGRGAKYTMPRRPVELVYSEEHIGKSQAMRREAAIKGLSREEKERLIMTNKRLLYVNATVTPESRTDRLARRVLSHLMGAVEEVDLKNEKIKPLTNKVILEREEAKDAGNYDLPVMKYAHQFAEVDEIVVAAPCWDMSFPAILKNYFEQVTVRGITFTYAPDMSYEGLCKAKKLFYVMTAGGPIMEPNHGYNYVRDLVTKFYGVPETELFYAEGLDIEGADVEAIMKSAEQNVDDYFTDGYTLTI